MTWKLIQCFILPVFSKYKFMEVNLLQRRKVLEEKIPEIEKTIAMVEFLTEKQQGGEPVYTDYELNDTLYCKAKVEPSGTVYLWLGVSGCQKC